MHDASLEWLLGSDEPGVRSLARRDLLGEAELDDDEVRTGCIVRTLLEAPLDVRALSTGEPIHPAWCVDRGDVARQMVTLNALRILGAAA